MGAMLREVFWRKVMKKSVPVTLALLVGVAIGRRYP